MIPKFNEETSGLTNATFMQFLSPKFGLIAGKIFLVDAFQGEFAGNYRTQFLNTALNFPTTSDVIPLSAYGGGVIVIPWDGFVLSEGATVLVLESEFDVLRSWQARQPDSERFRLWEVAGSTHQDEYVERTLHAQFAPLVFECAAEGDVQGMLIVIEGASAISNLGRALLARGAKRICLLGGLASAYPPYLDADVKRETRKLDSYDDFAATLENGSRASLKDFAAQRRAYLLGHPEIKALPAASAP